MPLSRCARAAAGTAFFWAVLSEAVLVLIVAALGFFAAGAYIWLARHFGAALAALAIVTVFIGLAVQSHKRKKQRLVCEVELLGTLGLARRLTSSLVRRDPKKAILIALIAGAVGEYFTCGEK